MSETENTEVVELSEAEQRASRLGWVPKDQFKGDPDKWRPAEEFLDRGMNMLPLLQRDNDKLHKGMSRLEKRLEEQARTFEEFQKYNEKIEERAYRRAKAELEAKLEASVQTGDVSGAKQATQELANLESERQRPVEKQKEPEKPQVDRVFKDWMDENPWFNSDPALTGYATKVFGDLEKKMAGKSHSELLAETKKKVMEKFPEEFGINPKRESAPSVSAPNEASGAVRKKGKTYDDLPPDAKKACDKFVKTIPGFTRDKYLATYDWD